MDALCMVGKRSPTTVSELPARNGQPRSCNYLLKVRTKRNHRQTRSCTFKLKSRQTKSYNIMRFKVSRFIEVQANEVL